MSIYDDIRATLEKTLADTAGLPTDIAWENINFTPTTGTSYLETHFIPTSRRPAVRGLNPQQRYQGLFRIVVNVPESTGPAIADDYVDTLLTAFDATKDLTYNSVTVTTEYAERSQGISDSPWYRVNVDIAWYKYN